MSDEQAATKIAGEYLGHETSCDGLYQKVLAALKTAREDERKAILARLDSAEKALKSIQYIAHHNFGRQTEKLADIEPIARAHLSQYGERT